jgi:tetratricopeptide (TPR) repeat protein
MRIVARRHADNLKHNNTSRTLSAGLHLDVALMQWNMRMRRKASRIIMYGVASILMLVLIEPWAAAQNSDVSNVDLCNGRDRKSPESQIAGCTALIKAGLDNPTVAAIAYNNRGNAYTGKGEYDKAIEDYDASIKLNPNYSKPFNNRGVAYQKKEDYDRAIQDFDAAIKIDQKYADAFTNRAETYRKKGDYPSALKDFDEAIQLQPKLKVLWNERCWTHAIVGELPAAMSDCNAAIQLEPDAATFDSRGFIYLKLGQWAPAIADYNSALRMDPKLPSALYGRGFAKLKMGDQAGGKADVAAAQALRQNIEGEFARYGLQ